MDIKIELINPATKLVIPAVAERRAGIQTKRWNYWIPAFAHRRQAKDARSSNFSA